MVPTTLFGEVTNNFQSQTNPLPSITRTLPTRLQLVAGNLSGYQSTSARYCDAVMLPFDLYPRRCEAGARPVDFSPPLRSVGRPVGQR